MARWFVWSGKVWKPDPGALMRGLAAKTARKTLQAAVKLADETQRRDLTRHALASERANAGRACVSQAETLEDFHIDTDDLDADPMALNTPSGLVDLRTGTLRAHDPKALCTKLTRAPMDGNSDCPVWLAFLSRVFNGNQELIGFLQRLVGYSLTGLTTEQLFILLWGAGSNGKSTLVEFLVWLLGDYGVTVDMSVWMMGRQASSGAATPERIPLRGARLSASVESTKGRRLNAAFIKQVTGGDRISARGLFEGQISFPPTFKPWMSTNHKPRIPDDSDGMWRRLILIPFKVQIPAEERDRGLMEKLRAEAAGVLAWAVDGCLAWQEGGLNPPDDVLAAVQEYREAEDALAAFLADRCDVSPDFKSPSGPLFNAWREWAIANEEEPGNSTSFGLALSSKGFESGIGTGGKRLRKGLRLRADDEGRLDNL